MLTLLVKHAHGTMRIVQGGHMCAGYNDDPTETAGKVYYGECQSADTAISSGKLDSMLTIIYQVQRDYFKSNCALRVERPYRLVAATHHHRHHRRQPRRN